MDEQNPNGFNILGDLQTPKTHFLMMSRAELERLTHNNRMESGECSFFIVKTRTYMRIPTAIKDAYFDPSPRHVTMSTADNEVRITSLTNYKGSIFFGHTMCNFIKHYNIRDGDKLLFTFDKVSHFKIKLYHEAGAEMLLPGPIRPRFAIIHEPPRIARECYSTPGGSDYNSDSDSDSNSDERSTFLANVIISDTATVPGPRPTYTVNQTELMQETERVFTYKPFVPFCLVKIRRADMGDMPMLKLPSKFARSELVEGKNDKTLVVYGKGRWLVKCYMFNGQAKIKNGWARFTFDHWLLPGDSCAFERSLSDKDTWNVTLFKEHYLQLDS